MDAERANINFMIKNYGYDGYGVDISKPAIKEKTVMDFIKQI